MSNNTEVWNYYEEALRERMTMNQYQNAASKTVIYKSTHSVLYPALGLAGEAGEVANKVKKMIRDNNFDRQGIAEELGDVLWYVAALSRDLNLDLHDIAFKNLHKLYGRKDRGTLNGSGDKR